MGDGMREDETIPCSLVMKAAGISRSALFNYERHGAVKPQRDENGYRLYTRGDLLDVMCCTMLTSMGYSVDEAAGLLREKDLMGVGQIEGYMDRLAAQRDAAQAKIDNLAALRRATIEARPPHEAAFELVDCDEWLFFFDMHESGDPLEVKFDNQVQLMRSVPLSCRGFVMEGFFDGALAYRWARTLRRRYEGLLDVDTLKACVLGGLCVRTVVADAYPALDADGTLRARFAEYLDGASLRRIGDPFVPLLLSNRMPSPLFEIFVPVERTA